MRTSFATYGYGRKIKETAIDFQQMIRAEAADYRGFIQCFTCNKVKHWKDCDAGHFISRGKRAVIFDEMNCHPQCKYCNQHLSGNPVAYSEIMVACYSQESVNKLIEKSRQDCHYTDDELIDMRIMFRDRTKAAQKKMG